MIGFDRAWKAVAGAYAERFEPEGVRLLLSWYWRMLLVASLLAVVAAVGFGVWSVAHVMRLVSPVPETIKLPAPAFDRAALDELVGAFAHRQDMFTRLISEGATTTVADPSR